LKLVHNSGLKDIKFLGSPGEIDWPIACLPLCRNLTPLYSNTVIGTLAVDGWAVTFGTVRRGLGVLRPRPVPVSLYQT